MKMKAFAFTGRIISSDSESYNFHSSPFSWYKHKCYFAFFFFNSNFGILTFCPLLIVEVPLRASI